MSRYLVIIFLLLFSLHSLGQENEDLQQIKDEDNIEEEAPEHITQKAKIQILNKITAKSQYVEVPVNSQITFGTIKIKVLKCLKSSPYELSENKILLDISEKKNGQEEYSSIFDGWMFSSSPAISSLEHAVYDITAISCHD
jgi:hypothetical protein